MVTGVIRPSGSNMLEVHLKISRFVAVRLNIILSGLGEALIVSELLSHHKPSTLTGFVVSATLCECTTLFSSELLEAQECKLKLALLRMDLD